MLSPGVHVGLFICLFSRYGSTFASGTNAVLREGASVTVLRLVLFIIERLSRMFILISDLIR